MIYNFLLKSQHPMTTIRQGAFNKIIRLEKDETRHIFKKAVQILKSFQEFFCVNVGQIGFPFFFTKMKN